MRDIKNLSKVDVLCLLEELTMDEEVKESKWKDISKKNEDVIGELVEQSQNMGGYDRPEDKIVRVLDKGFVRLVDSMGDDSAIVQAARVSYGKGTKSVSEDRSLIRYLMRRRHTSPFEMVEFKFHCRMPIFVARQWIRHRTANVNELSGRYSEIPKDCYIPAEDKVTGQSKMNKQGGDDNTIPISSLKSTCFEFDDEKNTLEIEAPIPNWEFTFKEDQEFAFDKYEKYLDTGMRRELARINLPLSAYTEWYWKIDLHNLFHFLKLRLDSHAQYEIRVYAEAIYQLIKELVPYSCEAFEDYLLDGMNLTAKDVEVLGDYLAAIIDAAPLDDGEFDRSEYSRLLKSRAENQFDNKRECEEFLNKMKRLKFQF